MPSRPPAAGSDRHDGQGALPSFREFLSQIPRLGRYYRAHGAAGFIRRAARAVGERRWPPTSAYRRWLQHGGVSPRSAVPSLRDDTPGAPLLSLLVPVHRAEPGHLRQLYASIAGQGYSRWELCLADDVSDQPELTRLIGQLAAADARIRHVRLEARHGISGATNRAASLARGNVLLFADQDDLLADRVLGQVAAAFAAQPELDLLYTDEDQITDWGQRLAPVFKPGPSPFLALSFNYLTHLLVVRRGLFERLGGLRSAFDGAQDHDLALRAMEQARAVACLPVVGYHWRRSRGSVASSSTHKPWAYAAGRRAVEEACRRRGLPLAAVQETPIAGVSDLRWEPPRPEIVVDLALAGGAAEVEAWTAALGGAARGARFGRVTLDRWPAAAERPTLVVPAGVQPDASSLRELLSWTGVPGVGVVAGSLRHGRRRADIGWSLRADGLAEAIAPGLARWAAGPGLLGSAPREVAAAAGAPLLVLPEAFAHAPVGWSPTLDAMGQLMFTFASSARGAPALFLPRAVFTSRSPRGPTRADLSRHAGWSTGCAALHEGFWVAGADRYCPRHPLLDALGMPASPIPA